MAEAVLEIVLEKLSSLAATELGLFLGFHGQKRKLGSMFTAIKATLQDAEEKQFSSQRVKDWLRKLKDAAYELEDIMDDCAYQELWLENQGVSHNVLYSFLSSFRRSKHAAFRYKIAKRMKSISERLDDIAKEEEQLHLVKTVPERRCEVSEWRQTTSLITEPQVYGREKDQDKIVDFLVGDASRSEDLSVYPIVGLGGLGKTTLAQLIFNHGRVVSHFELRIWVCVSEDFSLKRMTKAIIEAASGHASEDLDQEPLQRKLQDLLQHKRYLLVLDDVWDDEQKNWKRLRSVLACGAMGSSILVTTRLSTVAKIMGTMPSHDLSVLSRDDCWELFKHRAFKPNEVEHVRLEEIGKEIVRKCGGVPLAAKALGGLLCSERREEQWLNVKESNLWSLPHNIMPVLRLSYSNLPIKLRQCFAYCAIFPKDERIEKQHLIELWIANGFISSSGLSDAESVGDRVWYELYWRSFFQDLETDEFGKVTHFKMHDLVHDLAQSIAEEASFITKDNDLITFPERIQHLSHNRSDMTAIQLHKFKSLRSYVLQDRAGVEVKISSSDVLKCYSLRVLDFVKIHELPSSIAGLKHLRYLNLSRGDFKTLPESLCKLFNLQTLILEGCSNLEKLPSSLSSLKALQQLSLKGCWSLSSLPPHIGKLTSLRSLTTYFVGKEKGFLLAELGPLKLKGDLRIKHLERVKSVMDAKDANMSIKQLNRLRLSWDRNEEWESKEKVEEEILEVLQPDTEQLRSLELRGYKGVHFPQWMSSPSLKHLTSLWLEDCESLQLPALGKLPCLKSLTIVDMPNVNYVHEEVYDGGEVFVALQSLLLDNLPNLIRLSRDEWENMFPRLSNLEIRHKCKQDLLSSIYKLSSLETLSFKYNKELTRFPDGMLQKLTSLKTLHFTRLSKLEALPIPAEINVIKELYISGCICLESLPQGLHSLKKLDMRECSKFNWLTGLQGLNCIEKLCIGDRDVQGLPDALQNMTVLKELALWGMKKLESLPDCFGDLPSLRELNIGCCSKLRCLPTSLSLSSLEWLHIYDCAELEKRCEKETGEDWPKIAHIPHICIR